MPRLVQTRKQSEVEMPDESDDLFGEDENEATEELNRLSDVLFERISEFAEEEEVADEILPVLLLRHSLTLRMMAYVMSVAKPSGGGLKLDLDRYGRDIEELIREAKRDADHFVAHAKETFEAYKEEDET